ncbi:Zn-dependent hydrolase [Conexibacter sp. CPCC 206217]|uniref:Zn-dependent hydrolase n=1 Tax=Conexibacter sp. CPCC 206217 TaxID=3064574 RepID=UPI002727C517|nr:Zn-dependent hydrolase [Conexibacter sp. CPCC 206217]MDO8213292.1 Zn-dependent hydrolase [Conexibacter sp. CPCC 206217]
MSGVSISPQTLARTLGQDLEEVAQIGATGRGGISRFAWTDELAQAYAWVAGELEALGLVAGVDQAGNLIARWEVDGGDEGAVMAASHLDTVPNGGRFDGVLGVLGALEAVRILRRRGFEPARPIWIGSFMDEEGTRFGAALFGSRAFAGHDVSASLAATDAEGVTVSEAIAARGMDPARVGEAFVAPSLSAYLELHVEQGPVLDSAGERLGIVESITGVLGFHVIVRGEANHAGATPTDARRDALVGASKMVLALRERAREHSELRATVGRISTSPGAITVVPGECRFTVDLRPSQPEVVAPTIAWLRAMVAEVAASEGLEAEVVSDYELAPTMMDPRVVAALAAAAADEGVEPVRMWSGAGHDAMVIAPHAPTGMVFVPSVGGISHSPHEWTETADCELGARVLAGAIERLAG